nr:biotin-dependent carboxyltransferase family protein [Pelagibacterium limicola]
MGRPGQLAYGVSASGALDKGAYGLAGAFVGARSGAALEFSSLGLSFRYSGEDCRIGFAGGDFVLSMNGMPQPWPSSAMLSDGDVAEIATGRWGNYGYVRFDREIDCVSVMGSRSTNAVVGLGGRVLKEGDTLSLIPLDPQTPDAVRIDQAFGPEELLAPIRVVWSIHADLFSQTVKSAFIETDFQITARMDRMGVRLKDGQGVFRNAKILSLVSDSVVPGDIQILGDGTPIVLLRDHQPTGGYPRIATIISADLDRFAQIRPGKAVRFKPVTLETAYTALRAGRR